MARILVLGSMPWLDKKILRGSRGVMGQGANRVGLGRTLRELDTVLALLLY